MLAVATELPLLAVLTELPLVHALRSSLLLVSVSVEAD